MALFYTLEEAASLLGTSTFELRNRIQSKQVHALLIGGSWRLRIADVHSLMKSSHTQVAVQVPQSPAARPELGHSPVSAPESVLPASLPESAPPASIPESVPQASVLDSPPPVFIPGSGPPASTAESELPGSRSESVAEAFISESLAEVFIPESPSQPSLETPAEPSPHAAPVGPAVSPSVESLRESLNRVLQLARSQGMLVEGALAEPGSGTYSRNQEPTGNLGDNGSDDDADLSGPSRLEELFNLALESDHDEEGEAEVSKGGEGSPAEPSLAQALNLEESRTDSGRRSPEARTPLESKPASVTGKHSEAAVSEGRPRETTAAANNVLSPLELPKAKGPRPGQGGFFPVECPSCQALGQVPPNRMDQQLKCAECGTKFYLDLITNETIIGEKVTAKVAVPVADKKPVDSKGIDTIDAMTSLPQKTRLRLAAMALATIALAFGLYYFWPRVGNTPGERTAEILQALTHNSPGRVVAIAVPSSRADVEAWFKKVRPKDWPEVLPEVPVDINVISRKQARASTSIDFPPSVAIMPGSQEDPSGSGKGPPARSEYSKKSVGPRGLSLLLAWRYENGQWLFDATESLKRTFPPR